MSLLVLLSSKVCILLLFSLIYFSYSFLVVPIYDGHAVKGAWEFCFSDADFSKLNTWPLYEQGHRDLPFEAFVSVGYTLNTFGEGPRGGPNGLSTNLLFVILIALPLDI
jgi:hypothetical protein